MWNDFKMGVFQIHKNYLRSISGNICQCLEIGVFFLRKKIILKNLVILWELFKYLITNNLEVKLSL